MAALSSDRGYRLSIMQPRFYRRDGRLRSRRNLMIIIIAGLPEMETMRHHPHPQAIRDVSAPNDIKAWLRVHAI